MDSIPGSGRSPGEGNDKPLQCSCLKNPRYRGDWQATVHGVAKSWTWLSVWVHTHTHIYTHKWTYDKFCVNFKFLQLQNNCYVQWLSLESSDFFRNFWTSLIIRSILSKGIVTSFVCLIPLCRKDNNSWTIKEMKPQDFLQLFCSLQS